MERRGGLLSPRVRDSRLNAINKAGAARTHARTIAQMDRAISGRNPERNSVVSVERRLDVVPEDHEFPPSDGADLPPPKGDEVPRISARRIIERRILPEKTPPQRPSTYVQPGANTGLLTSRCRKSPGSAESSHRSSEHYPRHPLPDS